MDREMVDTYAFIQNKGFRVKLQCVKCGLLIDMDDYEVAFAHSLVCRGVVGDG